MTAWQADPFFQYPQTTVATSEGPVALPILYYDDSQCLGLFTVDYAVAQSMLAGEGLTAVRFAGGHAIAGVAFYEYRDTSIGVYNEVGVALAVVPDSVAQPAWPSLAMLRSVDAGHVGFHILDLPVTTPAACAAGRELWGYPKFVTPIRFALDHGRFRGAVVEPSGVGDIVEFSGAAGYGVPAPLLDLILYSRRDSVRLRTHVNTRGGGYACTGGSMQLQVPSSATHPMAERLRRLGLASARPVLVMHTQRLQLRLNAGAPLP